MVLTLVRPVTSAKLRTRRSCNLAALTGFIARWVAVRINSSLSVGTDSPCHSTGSYGQGASGSVWLNICIISTPAAPSIVA